MERQILICDLVIARKIKCKHQRTRVKCQVYYFFLLTSSSSSVQLVQMSTCALIFILRFAFCILQFRIFRLAFSLHLNCCSSPLFSAIEVIQSDSGHLMKNKWPVSALPVEAHWSFSLVTTGQMYSSLKVNTCTCTKASLVTRSLITGRTITDGECRLLAGQGQGIIRNMIFICPTPLSH